MTVNDAVLTDARPAYVQFETRAIENKTASLEQGKYVGEDVDFVMITPPGQRDVVEMKVETWFHNNRRKVTQGRFPAEWQERYEEGYQRWKKGQAIPLDGTAVKDWGSISPAQQKLLTSVGIYTVEDMAAANDIALRRIGMGAIEMKRKAQAWIQSNSEHGKVTMEMAALQKENDRLVRENNGLQEKVEDLANEVRKISMRIPEATTESTIEATTEVDVSEAFDVSRETLSDQYEAKFGEKPHHRMKDDTIRKRLKE